MRRLFIVGLGIVLSMVACTGKAKDEAPKEQVSIMLDWVPNTNHIGLYVAQAMGYLAEEGVELTILQAPEEGGLDFLLTNQVDLLIGWESTLFFGRDQGLPIVAVAAILQENDSVLVSLKENNILRPSDLVGKRYLSYGSANDIATVRAIMARDGVANPEVTLAATGSMADLNALVHGEGDYLWVFRGWDLLAAQLQGIMLNEIIVREYDDALNFYTPMILSTDENITKREVALAKAMRAIARGYEYAAEHPHKASEIFLRAVPGMDRALIEASTAHLATLYLNDKGRFGRMDGEVFARYLAWASAQGLLPNDGQNVMVDAIYTNILLER